MPRVPPPRRSPPRNLRHVNLLVRQIKSRPPSASPRTILTEGGRQLQTEAGVYLQTES